MQVPCRGSRATDLAIVVAAPDDVAALEETLVSVLEHRPAGVGQPDDRPGGRSTQERRRMAGHTVRERTVGRIEDGDGHGREPSNCTDGEHPSPVRCGR